MLHNERVAIFVLCRDNAGCWEAIERGSVSVLAFEDFLGRWAVLNDVDVLGLDEGTAGDNTVELNELIEVFGG